MCAFWFIFTIFFLNFCSYYCHELINISKKNRCSDVLCSISSNLVRLWKFWVLKVTEISPNNLHKRQIFGMTNLETRINEKSANDSFYDTNFAINQILLFHFLFKSACKFNHLSTDSTFCIFLLLYNLCVILCWIFENWVRIAKTSLKSAKYREENEQRKKKGEKSSPEIMHTTAGWIVASLHSIHVTPIRVVVVADYYYYYHYCYCYYYHYCFYSLPSSRCA